MKSSARRHYVWSPGSEAISEGGGALALLIAVIVIIMIKRSISEQKISHESRR